VEVLAVIGRGGMGEVYRARDTKLKRDVAIKTLPDEFSHDADRLCRFQREAEVLASLNHPNIAAIYDLQEAEGSRFLVLELVEGETLADRIARGPISIDEALPITKSISEALEAAHEQGIVHRDLKPANIKITPDGKVKVLDFGLAKAMGQSPATMLSNSPTLLSAAASNAGVILGTAGYMSPEQAKGKAVDKRADIWAFGVVLYEMLTGKMLFSGETVSETMAFVMTKEPEWSALPAKTPAAIRQLLRRCLTKDPRNRLRDVGEVRITIDGSQNGSATDAVIAPDRSRHPAMLSMSAFAVVTIIAAAMAIPTIRYFRAVGPPEIHLELNTPAATDPTSFAISPDGRRFVFVASSQLWIRPLDSPTAQPLAGTEGASYPFWSPDNESVGFFAGGTLKRVDIAGGAPQVLANAGLGRSVGGGAWNQQGIIIFSDGGKFTKVPAAGGAPTPIGINGFFPRFLPDGQHFFYFGGVRDHSLYLSTLDGAPSKRIMNADAGAVISPLGFLLFLQQSTLFAQAFDLRNLKTSGHAVPVAEQVVSDFIGGSGFSVALDTIAYRTASAAATQQLAWLDRSGKIVSTVGAPGTYRDIELSPDGKHIALTRPINGNTDVWLIDAIRGVPTRFTFDASLDQRPIWSPDGRRVAFASNRSGVYNLYTKASNGAGAEELLLESDQIKAPHDWSPDGQFLLYRSTDSATNTDLWVLPLSGGKKPFLFLKTPFEERDGQFSPDGKWIAYQSNESGQFEIYVQPFPGPGGKFQISTNGGAQPRWNKNGKEIFFISLDSKMMTAPVKLSSDSQSLETGAPSILFQVRIAGGPLPGIFKQEYAVSADGQQFLVNLDTGESTISPINVTLNWKPPKP
jgi:serine/threonine protein kinase